MAHLIRRCRDLAAVATPATARFPLRVKAVLEDGLALRDRYATQAISLHGLWTATGRLEVKLDRLLASGQSHLIGACTDVGHVVQGRAL